MNQISPFGMPPFDPSKMDPQLLMELSALIQELPPSELNRMQTLMHNMMAGLDVKKEMEEFERNLPSSFKARLSAIMLKQASSAASSSVLNTQDQLETNDEQNVRDARLTILRGVAEGRITPEEAERILAS